MSSWWKVSTLRKGPGNFLVEDWARETSDSVFREFYTDPEEFAFDKTKILVKLYTRETIYISRSQARRFWRAWKSLNRSLRL